MNGKGKSFLVRYGVSTLGLVVVALGVGLSIKSYMKHVKVS